MQELALTFKEASDRLAVDVKDVKWNGYSISEWEEDFKLKASLIQRKKQEQKLAKLEAQLKDLISEETKTEMAIDDIEKLLG